MELMDEIKLQKLKNKEAELRNFLYQLDTIGEILYNNLEYPGVLDYAEKFEDLRIKYYLEHYEYEDAIKRGLNGKEK